VAVETTVTILQAKTLIKVNRHKALSSSISHLH